MQYIELGYQTETIENIKSAMQSGIRKMVVCMATGAGKTIVFSRIASLMAKRESHKYKMLILVDRKILNEQTGGKLSDFGIDYSVVNQSTKQLPESPFAVGMVETIKRRIDNPEYIKFLQSFRMIVIDEAHKSCFDDLFAHITVRQYVVGFTATPVRTGKMRPLNTMYQHLIVGAQIKELIEIGRLSAAKSYGVMQDLSKIRMLGGDYNERDLDNHYKERKVYSGVSENLLELAAEKKTLIFASGIDSSMNLTEDLVSKGHNARHIDSYMTAEYKREIMQWFDATPNAVLSNVGILATGFDQPDILCIVLFCATTSLPLFLQKVGRGGRVTETKKWFLVLDFGNNIFTHGFWEQPRIWSLNNAELPKKKQLTQGVAPVKMCKICGALIPASAKSCEYCGTDLQKKRSKIQTMLEELSYEELQKYMSNAPLIELEEIRIEKKYKQGWLLRQLTTYEQFKSYAKLMNYKPYWAYLQAKRYKLVK